MLSTAQPVASKRPLPVSFGTDISLNILPTEFESKGWGGVQHVFVQDLSDDSLYQSFSARNAGYLAKSIVEPVESTSNPVQSTTPATSTSQTTPDNSNSSTSSPNQSSVAPDPAVEAATESSAAESVEPPAAPEATEPDNTAVDSQPEQEPEPATVDEASALAPVTTVRLSSLLYEPYRVFNLSAERFPLLLESTSTSIVSESEQDAATANPVEPPSSEVPVTEFASEPEPTLTPEPEPVTASDTLSTTTDAAAETSGSQDSAASSSAATSSPATAGANTLKITAVSEPVATNQLARLTLQNFDVPDLEPGQFLTGAQLRVSFGAQLADDADITTGTPTLEIFFGTATSMTQVGSIIIDGEVSNAINGGYFLFALPEIDSVSALESAQVEFRFADNPERVEGLFLDAAWLEVQTKQVSKADIAERGKAKNLQKLKAPKLTTMVSDKTNFDRKEAPFFNLRYQSQGNRLVTGVRSFFGADAVKVERADILHNSFGLLGIKPDVSVTAEGLLTIVIPDEQLVNMRPGRYTVVLELAEGKKTYTEEFDFQWGILSINPNKSEYEIGETVDLSIGALTPSGHTVCEAKLDLYIINPLEQIERVVVDESGYCNGNNITDVPDFITKTVATEPGEHTLYLERLDDDGTVLGFVYDSFLVTPDQRLGIERVGPTRIYPPAPYPMELTVTAKDSFLGTLTERVPRDFKIASTSADITVDGKWQVLSWDMSIRAGQSETVSYQFDAPDLSPYLYELGPAALSGKPASRTIEVASTTASTTELQTITEGGVQFTEHREWKIASDAVGNMILFWADGASIPTDWSCLSCGSGVFDQVFPRGDATYNSTGGSANHVHTYSTSLLASASANIESGSGGPAIVTHSHTLSPTITPESNLPEYRDLRVIQYTAAAGEPPTIPAGAIGIFDVASSSLPTDWNRYTAQDGKYVRGGNTPGATAGSNTHAHTISGTTGGSTGGTARSRGGGSQQTGAADGHTHTVSTNTGTVNNEPPYIEVVLAQASANTSPVNGLIALWTEEVGGGWIDVSTDGASAFNGRFIKASTTYGATGGAASHNHADLTGVVTSAPNTTLDGRTGAAGATGNHTHNVSFTGFSTDSNLPPYATAVFGKRQGTDPVYEQLSYRWYADNGAQTPTDPWPNDAVQALDLAEREPISATSSPVQTGDVVRLRINVDVTNATATAGSSYKLQYAAAPVCTAATSWFDVGDIGSTTPWRGYNITTITDESTLSSTLLASTTIAESYEETGVATSSPNEIPAGDTGEWEFVLEQNDAAAGTVYCFRMVEGDGSTFVSYGSYPQLFTNEAPDPATLETLFDNEKTASTAPQFTFVSVDPEVERIHYEIQIDNNPDFSSPEIERDSIDDAAQFENQVLISDKAPFRSGELIKFTPVTTLTNGTTYYWRVRGADPDGSDQWGDYTEANSFTVDTTLVASAWYQTENEQFIKNTLSGVEATGDSLSLITGSTTGSVTSQPIVFADGERGTAWDSLEFTESDASNVLFYQIEYLDTDDEWALIPDTDLTGNSSGFGGSPVNLLGLDVDVYSTIRVIADFTANTGTPSLSDWTVNWGYRVDTPTIEALFSSEQTGTTTPTFTFTTTDPQGDDLTYQIEWDTTPDFTAPTTRTSDTNTGFANLDVGADTDPFNSGDTMQFTIQPADALTGTTTYWWRVRAKDPLGDDAYSFWTDASSFTVIPGTEVSTWFQTTADQFTRNIRSGTVALPTGSVTVATTATEAMIVYGEGTETVPRYREWDGAELTNEGTMLDIGAPLKWAAVAAGTTREEYVAVTVGTDNDVNAQVFSTGVWGNQTELSINMGSVNARGFDVAYETVSGDALVVYCDNGADPSYEIWDGSSWTSGGTINLTTTSNCEWIELTSHPTTDEIIINTRDAAGNAYEVQVWDGTAWGNASTFGQPRVNAYGGIDVVYEASGDQAIAVAPSPGGGPNRMVYNVWNGTAWSGETTLTIGGRLYWADLATSPDSDNIVLCYQNDNDDVRAIRWTGTAWAGDTSFTTTVNATADAALSCVYEASAGRTDYIVGAYSGTAATNYRTWNTTAWSAETQINTIGDAATMQLMRTGDALVLGTFFDDANDRLQFATWDGSAWSTTQTFEDNASVDTSPYGRPYFMAPRNSGRNGTTIVSPGLDFNDGRGPYWDSFSWNDSQPGTSEILYRLQYKTATGSWAFIPDTDLPDNGAGTTTGPFDLSSLNTNTYNEIRPYAELSCDNSGNCPEISDWKIEWAGGIVISGTIANYTDTAPINSGTVAVAVNGVLQTGKTGAISSGAWSINNVTAFPGDIITVFVTGAADASEAVGVARYDGQGNMSGLTLFERHLSIGSNDATTTPITNSDIGQYDFTNTEDIFFNVNGSGLTLCADGGCTDSSLYIVAGTRYQPGGTVVTHDFENNGTFIPGSNTIELSGSWDNNATTTMTGSTVVFAATSSAEVVDSTGVQTIFNNVTFGTTTGSGTWSLANTLDVDGNLTVNRGTLARGSTPITVAKNLLTAANGFWSGLGTTTFDGTSAATWGDQNATLQNIGYAVIDGTGKIISLSADVFAESVTIGSNDTLDASVSNHSISVNTNWTNTNNFLPRSGSVSFVGTTTGHTVTTAGDAFYDLTVAGAGGSWAFDEPSVVINNDLTIATGTLTLPNNGTTTVAGSFDATGGFFQNNNGTLYFTSNNPETITFAGGDFTNVAHNLTFNGGGSWTITDTHATATNDVLIDQGTVIFPTGTLAIGGTVEVTAGGFTAGTGTTRFYSSNPEILTANGSSFGTIIFDGTGSWSFADTNVTATEDVIVTAGTVTTPSGTLTIGGSYDNQATVTAAAGTVLFDSSDTGETVNFGIASLYDVSFDNPTGGWTIVGNATATNDFALASSSDFTVQSGATLAVGGVFTNYVGGASTTWTGSTLALTSGAYSANRKTDQGDSYEMLVVSGATDVSFWNSDASTYVVASGGSVYSQDHSAVDGDLYIYGDYEKVGGSEYWSYATDFDGTNLTASSAERTVNVRLADGSTVNLTDLNFAVLGISTASSTVASQGGGTYNVTVSGGTTTAQYYSFSDLGATGLSFLDGAYVPTLRDGSYTVAAPGGTALTLSSTTIDANPGKQIFNVRFATTTAIAATNVTQLDGVPASYWWFRQGQGNLYGEAYDNDTGDPGSVRFDDSSLVLTISGTVYGDAGVTPLTGGATCDGSTQVVHVYVEGTDSSYTGSCDAGTGAYSVGGVIVVGDPTITIYLNNAPDGERGSVITRTPTANITDADIYANRVIVRNEDTEPLTIDNLALRDSSNDVDLQFTAATSTNPDTLTVASGNELFVWASSTFTPGGVVTLAGEAAANGYDGTLFIGDGATFNAFSSSTLTIGGRLELGASSTFSAASTTVLMNASTSGKSITAPDTITFNELTFNGTGGSWNVGADIVVTGDMTLTAGTVTGTGDITLPTGSLTGAGVLSLGGGTTTLGAANTLGGTSAWTFYNLQLGDTFQVGTTTPVFTSTTTIAGRLTVAAAHYLDAGATSWDLSGVGTVFVENGTFLEDTSTIRYSGGGANVLSTQYYNLDINSGAGSQTYTATGLGIIIDGDLTVGGDATTLFDLNTADPAFDINGDVLIRSNGTLSSSDTASITLSGSYDNNGVFAGNGGTLAFDGAGTVDIAAGGSTFASVFIAAPGDITVSEHATATDNWTLSSANTFTLVSGQTLAVGDTFFNALSGTDTTWTGSTLRLYGGNNYSINAATSSDSYDTLTVEDTTQIRMWNSDATTYDVAGTASLYSQDHADVAGDLYIWGEYRQTSATDFWSYATDFDGTALGGSSRKVDVYLDSGASVTVAGGFLDVTGISTASTTIQNQGSGTYSLTVGGNASTSMRYYEVRDIDSDGLTLTATPKVVTLSNGDIEVSQNGGSAMTIGGTVINTNPAKNFTGNRFALNGVGSGFNVTATGTSVSAWRFTSHSGDIDGESFDVDPGGDPGYVAWDDSAALITISGNVYQDDGATVSTVCSGGEIRLVVAGLSSATTSCNVATGFYSFSNVAYGPTDSLIVYINDEAQKGASVTDSPVSNISSFDIYENHVIVRHENTDPITIADMAVYDSSDDADIPFTAVDAGIDTLTLPVDRKLIVWTTKTFAPGGDVTLSSGGIEAYGGSLELQSDAVWTGAGAEALSIGGSFETGANAVFTASNGTTTFTTTGAGRVIDVNESDFTNVAFTGSGSWTVTDPTLTTNGTLSQTAGTLTLPTGTTTVAGSFSATGGSFDASGGVLQLTGTGAHTLTLSGSDLADLTVIGGDYVMNDTNATTTGTVSIVSGDLTFPSGVFAIGGGLLNTGGSITHNTSDLRFTATTSATIIASSSDLSSVVLAGGANYDFADNTLSLLGNLIIASGSAELASTSTSIGGSFTATGGTFNAGSSTVLFNSSDTGETINPGTSSFYSVRIAAPTGGYTITSNATATRDFVLASAANFVQQSGTTLTVERVFLNSVGGTNTTWSGSTLALTGPYAYRINEKSDSGDAYDTLVIGANADLRSWYSSATTTVIDSTSSLYSQDNAGVDGNLYIYGDFHVSASSTEYWSYATDFDSTGLTGFERAVTVYHAAGASTTVDGGSLQVVGVSGNETAITNQSSGTYGLSVTEGILNAQYYAVRNVGAAGLSLSGTPLISSLSYGDYELAVDGGTLISLSSTTLNANASLVIPGTRFATTTPISGNNVTLTGVTSNAWTFTGHIGNLDGEDYDVDGVDACGSIRWGDSQCLITQQTAYRWRTDDGGLGVPASEWYDVNWDARQRVRVENVDATPYTDAVVQLIVPYDADMQTDYDDLRFTGVDGTTLLSHWIGSTTANVMAEVWVEVPSLPAEDTTTLFMYYNNPTATSSASLANTFIAGDDFEDGNVAEYSGETVDFTAGTDHVYDGSNGLEASDDTGRTESGGMYRLDETVSQGETIRVKQYIDTVGNGSSPGDSTDEFCTIFGVQSAGAPSDNYGVCVDLNGTDRLVLVRDAVDSADSIPAVTLDTANITVASGWYTIEIDWSAAAGGTIDVSMVDESGSSIATLSATDSNYTNGGYGFSYWFQHGGWDGFTTRPTLTTEPTYLFGVKQTDGGASWAAAENSTLTIDPTATARLRFAIENSGLDITNQQFRLEYAPLASAPSCEAVSGATYQTVPLQASCAGEPVCMQSSANVTNGASTVDLLTDVAGIFTAGQARENPSNTTTGINVDQDEYTELEYVITPTLNVVDENLCFRVTNAGTEYDTYLKVARLTLRFDPVLDAIILNEGNSISLLPGTTTAVFATTSVTDLNGYTDIVGATTTFYRSGVAGGAACTPDNNNCYVASGSQCQFVNCVGNTCDIECRADIYFHADPTDSGSTYEGQEWFAFMEVEDTNAGVDFDTSIGQELLTLRAIDVLGAIDYGNLTVNSDTGSSNASTSIENFGNVEADVEILGTDLSDGFSSVIPSNQQKFATTTFTYSACGASCALLSSTTPINLDVDLTKPTSSSPFVTDDVYWGIAIPFGINSAPHQGVNVFTPVSP